MQSDSTSISFQPLSGAKSEAPFAYLLHIDEYTILLDCGWSDNFDVNELTNLIECCSRIDAVLLSHVCIEHIGALPYLCRHHNLTAPIFATYPVVALGSLLLYDHYRNKLDEGDFDLFNAQDIKSTFHSITWMTYQQEMHLGEIIVTPYKAGRSIGGAVWRITKGQNEIIYTNSIYHGNDKHLDGFTSISQWHPTLWILDARGGGEIGSDSKRKPIEEFFRPILDKLNRGKVILFPIDGVARTLEILLQLNDKWKQDQIPYPIYFVSHCSQQILDTVNQMSEWLASKLTEMVVDTNESPFDLAYVKCINSIEELPRPESPFVVLATSDTLEHGFSRKIFLNFVGETAADLVYFTTHEPKNSLAEQLRRDNTHRELHLIKKYRKLLEGQELLEYRRNKEMERSSELIVDSFSDSDESEDDEIQENDARPAPTVQIKSKFQFTSAKKAPVTDYGAHIEHADYAKGVQHAALIEEKQATSILQSQPQRSIIEEPEDIPSKIITQEHHMTFRALSMYYDFEARTNFFSMQSFLKKCSPSHIIIIGGTLENTMKLHDVIKDNMNNVTISTPSVMESVYLSQDQTSMKIGLSRALYTRLEFKKFDEFSEIAYIDANLATDDITGMLQAKLIETSRPHHANFVGKIDMPSIRTKLIEAGIKTTGQGKLVCGSRKVEIRQVGENSLAIDGVMCADFIKVRNIIQNLLTMV